jgi:hypothetical protein
VVVGTVAYVIDIRHWLDERTGELPEEPPRLRRLALKVARLIEAGGPLKPGETRETLVECSRRPKREQCLGLLWVEKFADEQQTIHAFCLVCRNEELYISGWQDTEWAEGPMEPAPVEMFRVAAEQPMQ